MNKRPKRIILLFGVFLLSFGGSLLFPQARLYVAAWAGSSTAMYKIADEYYSEYGSLFHFDSIKGDYWRRRAVSKGNLIAMQEMIQRWDISNPQEVVYWLKQGCDLGIPWCAEELARAYEMGLYQLPIDSSKTGKVREYDNLAVELHRKKGTLKDHTCALLPWVSPSAWPRPVPKEIHPGIPWEPVSKK